MDVKRRNSKVMALPTLTQQRPKSPKLPRPQLACTKNINFSCQHPPHPVVKIAALGDKPSSGPPIKAVLAGVQGGPLHLGTFPMTKDIMDMNTNSQGLGIKAILTRDNDLTIPIRVGYTTYLGDKLFYQGLVMPGTNVSTFKRHLTHVHPLRLWFKGRTKLT